MSTTTTTTPSTGAAGAAGAAGAPGAPTLSWRQKTSAGLRTEYFNAVTGHIQGDIVVSPDGKCGTVSSTDEIRRAITAVIEYPPQGIPLTREQFDQAPSLNALLAGETTTLPIVPRGADATEKDVLNATCELAKLSQRCNTHIASLNLKPPLTVVTATATELKIRKACVLEGLAKLAGTIDPRLLVVLAKAALADQQAFAANPTMPKETFNAVHRRSLIDALHHFPECGVIPAGPSHGVPYGAADNRTSPYHVLGWPSLQDSTGAVLPRLDTIDAPKIPDSKLTGDSRVFIYGDLLRIGTPPTTGGATSASSETQPPGRVQVSINVRTTTDPKTRTVSQVLKFASTVYGTSVDVTAALADFCATVPASGDDGVPPCAYTVRKMFDPPAAAAAPDFESTFTQAGGGVPKYVFVHCESDPPSAPSNERRPDGELYYPLPCSDDDYADMPELEYIPPQTPPAVATATAAAAADVDAIP